MSTGTLSFVRSFFASCRKERVLENIQNYVTRSKCRPYSITSQFGTLSNTAGFPHFKNVILGSGQNLMVPSSVTCPVWKDNSIKSQISWNVQNDGLKQILSSKSQSSPSDTVFGLSGMDVLSLKESLTVPPLKEPLTLPPIKEPLSVPPSIQFSVGQPSFKACLMDEIQCRQPGDHKVTVVGCGCVGIACSVCILQQQITNQLCLVDVNKNRVLGEITDLNHGSTFFSKLHLNASTGYEASAGSKVCVIAAGVRRKEGESRLDLMDRNIKILKEIIPPLLKYSPNAVFIIVSNPVDILAYLFWKISGLPKGRVFGSGCELDTSRFRVFIGERLGLAPGSCHGWIIGEHGDSSVPVWSSVNVAGARFMDLNPCIGTENDPDNWKAVHKKVVTCAAEVLHLKGHTAWAIGMTCAALTQAVLNNVGTVHSVSVDAKGYHDIEEDVFLSLPASIGINGVNDVIKQTLTESEKCELHKSAKILNSKQSLIKI